MNHDRFVVYMLRFVVSMLVAFSTKYLMLEPFFPSQNEQYTTIVAITAGAIAFWQFKNKKE